MTEITLWYDDSPGVEPGWCLSTITRDPEGTSSEECDILDATGEDVSEAIAEVDPDGRYSWVRTGRPDVVEYRRENA